MFKHSIFSAILISLGIYVLGQILYIGVLTKISISEILRYILLVTPAIAAYFAAYLSPRYKFLIGLLMSIPGALIALIAAYIFSILGFNIDEIGTVIETFLIVLAYFFVIGLIGAIIGARRQR